MGFLLTTLSGGTVSAQNAEFILENNTGFAVYSVYFWPSASESDYRGPDRLGDRIIPSGASHTFTPRDGEVADEYGHNTQQEAGKLTGRRSALPTELNADCLAGTWGHWAYGQGQLDPGDTQEALDAALAVGDFDYLSPQHHGTPQQRQDALQTGLNSDTTAACDKYLAM